MATQEQIDELVAKVCMRADLLRRILPAAQRIIDQHGKATNKIRGETTRRVDGIGDFSIELTQRQAGIGSAVLTIHCHAPTETVGEVLRVNSPGIFSTTSVLMHGTFVLDERLGLQTRLVEALEKNDPKRPELKPDDVDPVELNRTYDAMVTDARRLGLQL